MADLTELSRAIGSLESSVQTLFHKYDSLYIIIKRIDKNLSKRQWWNSAKIFTGAFCGGATVVAAKMAMWG